MEPYFRYTGGDRGRQIRAVLPGLIVLALVTVASVLLVVGYGVPVGVGVLVGLAIGVVGGLFAGLWLGVRSRGRSMTIGGLNLSSTNAMSSHESSLMVPEVFRDVMHVQRVDHGALVRVIPGGVFADAGGVHVEVIALEIRPAGAVVHMAAAIEPPNVMLGSFARVAVEDDLGTSYVAAAMGDGGSADRTRFQVRLAPAPPAGATVLRIRIDEFLDPFPMHVSGAIAGPWLLTVILSPAMT